MAKQGTKRWLPTTRKKTKPKVPEREKQLVQDKFNEMIEKELKPKYIEPPPTDNDFNYRVDIFSKWYRNYFYLCSLFNCPSPRAIAPSFESRFARLEYVKPDAFNLAYMRHTGQWWEICQDLTLEECLQELRTNPNLANFPPESPFPIVQPVALNLS
ncbi:MAG: hypothetical protein F6K36_28705 [Symploca sp. SIO3C6]|uniref:Uncharacterized protein n=1 Tax=Symploca sp. SIO1C4 TaxID=2607765 RepID=A0A6B3N666_9CYAN|nr:hypothetical protein [Symploca sp. SIO3C6]NER29216.1 hypothetical protein [Symploca sp. SIO1C4]